MIRDGQSQQAPMPEDRFPRKLLFDPEKGVRNKSYSDLACLVDYSKLDPIAAAADKIKEPIAAFSNSQDGSALAGIDGLIPSKAKGTAWQP